MPTPPLPSRDDEPMTPPDVEAVSMDPLDPIKHPLRDEAERAWMAGYARQGILSYSKRPPSPFAQFLQGYVAGRAALLARLNEAEARANTATVAADLMRDRAEKAERFLSMLFESHWDGTIGRPPTWHLRGDFRHILAGLRGETLEAAIEALGREGA